MHLPFSVGSPLKLMRKPAGPTPEVRSHQKRRITIEPLEPRHLLSTSSTVVFDDSYLLSYDNPEDFSGEYTVGPTELGLAGDIWKAVQLSYNVTPDTVIEFDFESTVEGDVHGIGVDTDLNLDLPYDLFFSLYGTDDNFGNRDLDRYEGTGVHHYRLPIGEYFQGYMKYLVFGGEHDVAKPTSNSRFSDIVIYENPIDMSDYALLGYGGREQYVGGTATLEDDPSSVHFTGNTWRAMLFSYDVTPRTRLEFDFYSPIAGELQGIGVDTDLRLSADDAWFKLHGSEDTFGNRDFDGAGGTDPRHYLIPLGEYFQGQTRYLTFGNDHDVATPTAESVFANIYVYEAGIDFNQFSVLAYGGPRQDVNGTSTIEDEGTTLRLAGNTWKAIPFDYTVTPNTVVEFDFEGGPQGEMHGIGVDTDLQLSSGSWFNLWGTQSSFSIRDFENQRFTLWGTQSSFGIRDFENQPPGMSHYVLPIGQYFQGEMEYLTFGNDHDVPHPTAESLFSNVRVYELQDKHRLPVFDYEIVVYGGTPAGVMTAVQAARLGKSVVLIEPGDHVGGLMSSGLGLTDVRFTYAVGGLSREFFQRIKDYYDDPGAWTFQSPEDYSAYNPNSDVMWRFEPHVAEAVFEDFLEESFIPVVRRQRLDRDAGVALDGNAILSVSMESDATFIGSVFVDASYEGDLMAAAGVSYKVGREGNDVYGETLNGVQTTDLLQSTHPVDPYVIPGDPTSGLIPGVHSETLLPVGTGDDRVQAYNFRMTLTDVPENGIPISRPENYDEGLYELFFRAYEAGNDFNPFSFHRMPNLKTDSNGARVFSTDFIGANYAYPEASYEVREQIVQSHVDYQQGLFWTVSNHPRIPDNIRSRFQRWYLASDEYLDNDHWPFQIYVREARRMVSDYVMTEANGFGTRVAEDSIGLGTYSMDSHFTQRYVGPEGNIRGEGLIFAPVAEPFAISYRSIVPRVGETENLIVPTALSASHVAFGGIRLEPTYMILGHSAGTAASLAIDSNVSVQELNYDDLRQQLIINGQILDMNTSFRSGVDPGVLDSRAGGDIDGNPLDHTVWLSRIVDGRFWSDPPFGHQEQIVDYFGPSTAVANPRTAVGQPAHDHIWNRLGRRDLNESESSVEEDWLSSISGDELSAAELQRISKSLDDSPTVSGEEPKTMAVSKRDRVFLNVPKGQTTSQERQPWHPDV